MDLNRVTELQFTIQQDFDRIVARFTELDPAKDGDIGSVVFFTSEVEVGVRLDHDLFIQAQNLSGLHVGTFAGTPAGEDTELEQSDGELWCVDGVDDTNKGIAASCFDAYIFTD